MVSNYKMSSSSNQRGKPYALVLLLAFGAAIIGVMVLHKLREKRIFSLLVKEKDHELLALHLLFQREQEFNKDARKKIEEMKTKVYSLRSQKLELDRRLSEMESTIASLRDERKVIESTLEEKKNEIKMLTEEGMDSSFPNVSDIRKMIKMKETEIEHLKQRLNQTETILSNKGMMGENERRAEDDIQENGENLASETEKSNDLDDEDEPQMRQEAGLYKRMDDQGGNADNGATFINVGKIQGKKIEVGILNVTDAKVNDTSISHDDPRDQESQQTTSALRDGLKSEKLGVGVNGLGIKVRRRQYRVKKFRDIRNRRYAGITETGLSNQDADVESDNSQKQVDLTEIHPTITEKLNQTLDSGRKNGESTVTKSNEAEKTEKADRGSSMSKGETNRNGEARFSSDGKSERLANSEGNVEKQIADETNDGHDIDANRKLLKMNNIDVTKSKGDSEEGNETEEIEEGEGDDSEDTREPEIDRADIKRFAESDPDEEEAEEVAEETEI